MKYRMVAMNWTPALQVDSERLETLMIEVELPHDSTCPYIETVVQVHKRSRCLDTVEHPCCLLYDF